METGNLICGGTDIRILRSEDQKSRVRWAPAASDISEEGQKFKLKKEDKTWLQTHPNRLTVTGENQQLSPQKIVYRKSWAVLIESANCYRHLSRIKDQFNLTLNDQSGFVYFFLSE